MRSTKLNYVLVGLFVLASLVGMVVAVALLTGRTGATDSYYSIYNNVSGVKFGTQVVYEGYPIGQVTDVKPVSQGGHMNFRVDFDVVRGWRIPVDSKARIAAPGLLAAVTLAIHAGESSTALKPGSEVLSEPQNDMFSALSSVAGEFGKLSQTELRPLLDNLNKTAAGINELLRAGGEIDQSVGNLNGLLKDTRDTVATVRDRLPKIADNLERSSASANEVVDRMTVLLDPANQRKIEDIMTTMQTASHNFDKTLIALNSTIADADDLLNKKGDAVQTLSQAQYITESIARHIDAINQNLESAARNMNEFTRQIRQNPSLLLGSKAAPDQAAHQ
ncbi:MAG: MlaD family protein [Arenicellales bacterium]